MGPVFRQEFFISSTAYWEVVSPPTVGMGLLMGCGTWALPHVVVVPLPEKFLIFPLKMKRSGGLISRQRFCGGALAVSLFCSACVTRNENMTTIQQYCQCITYK